MPTSQVKVKRSIDRRGRRFGIRFALAAIALLASACTTQNPKSRFLLAEKLWHEGKYQASVAEYERVFEKEQGSDLGLQSAYRAGMTQTLFLDEHLKAIREFNRIVDLRRESPLAHEASRQIGEILFVKLEQYEQAVGHYQRLIELYPKDPMIPEYLYRIGKSQFYQFHFAEAADAYEKLLSSYPDSAWAEKAEYELGANALTRGQHETASGEGVPHSSFKESIERFQKFIKKYPASKLIGQAKFEMATAYEELDQNDAARDLYEELKGKYPTPGVVEFKLRKLSERKAQKNVKN